MAQKTQNEAIRMKVSMVVLSLHRRGAERGAVGSGEHLALPQPLDDEEQGDGTADRDRRIGETDTKDRELADVLMPGRVHELGAPDQHEQVDGDHAGLSKK